MPHTAVLLMWLSAKGAAVLLLPFVATGFFQHAHEGMLLAQQNLVLLLPHCLSYCHCCRHRFGGVGMSRQLALSKPQSTASQRTGRVPSSVVSAKGSLIGAYF